MTFTLGGDQIILVNIYVKKNPNAFPCCFQMKFDWDWIPVLCFSVIS